MRCLLAGLVALLLLAGGSSARAASQPTETALIVSYMTQPANRSAFVKEMLGEQSRRLDSWKRGGVLKSYQLFVSRYADGENWAASVVLTFVDTAAMAKWHAIERVSPGGLSSRAQGLVSSIETTPVDLFVREEASTAKSPRDSAFLIIPYDYLVSLGEYKSYLNDYTIPQFRGWIEEGALQSYDFYLARYPADRTWSALLVLEYKNDTALADRSAVTAKVRERLAKNPSWKAISDSKQAIRKEGQVVIADQIVP